MQSVNKMSTTKFDIIFETCLIDLLDGVDFQPPIIQDNTEPGPLMYSLDSMDFQPPIIQDHTDDREPQTWSQAIEELCGSTDVCNVSLTLVSEAGNADWVDSQSHHSADSGSSAPSASKTTQSGKTMKLRDEELNLQCEWKGCDYHIFSLDHFVSHVSLHIPQLEVKLNKDETGVYVCLWQQCGFESADSNLITRHVNFHSYHTKVKCIGSNIMARSKLPICKFDHSKRNMVPDLPNAFECRWGTCEQTFNNLQKYIDHVDGHVSYIPRGRKVKGSVCCRWRGCISKSMYDKITRLSDHVRSHTQEKLVGCPTCGGLFATRTKFHLHCTRQARKESQQYQCPRCQKHYQSEQLLEAHRAEHMDRHTCPFCGKAFPWPSSVSVHIRYRHLDYKPFKCPVCEYRAKTRFDMKHHSNSRHSGPLYRCEETGCDFSCRSAYGLSRHRDKCHGGSDEPRYSCHLCDSLFHRGALLTRHLCKQHDIYRPVSRSRLRYRQDGNGMFHLQQSLSNFKKQPSPRGGEVGTSHMTDKTDVRCYATAC
jgi:predicted RNA-binding Zn-ribbon protein involved in translation (DUF1610 family)